MSGKPQLTNAEIEAQFHALLGEGTPLTTALLEPYFEYLAIAVCYRLVPNSAYPASVERTAIAKTLFIHGCTPLNFFAPIQLVRLADSLMTGHLPSPALSYQLFTYILRLEKYQCRSNLRYMMPLFALTELPPYPVHPERSRIIANTIQAFISGVTNYTPQSIRKYDPLDLLAKLQRIIRCIANNEDYQDNDYLLCTFDVIRYIATAYLGVYVKRTVSNSTHVEQAKTLLVKLANLHQTIVNEDLIHHLNT